MSTSATGPSTRWWPLSAATGYALILLVGLFVAPTAPGVDASGTELVRFYGLHGNSVRTAGYLGAVSLLPLACLLAYLRDRLTGVTRDVAMFGAVGLIAGTIVWSWFGLALALHPASLTPSVARAVADVSAYFGPVLTVSIILLIAPVGLAAWRRGEGLPRWLAWITLVFGVEQAIETITIFGRHGFTAPGGDMNFKLGASLFILWIVAAGLALAFSPRTEACGRD